VRSLIDKTCGVWIFLFFSGIVILTLRKAALLMLHPVPFAYGEGIMTWMSWRIGQGLWPYGDILGVPSVYSCYGPLPAALALALASISPSGSGGEGAELFQAGRVLSFLSWLCVAVCVAAIRQDHPWQRALAASAVFAVFAGTVFLYAWRVDPFLCAVLSGALLYYSRHPTTPSIWAGVGFAVAVAMTKPTALVDFCLFFSMGVVLGGGSVGRLAPYVAKIITAAVGLLVTSNFLSGGWMLNNILSIQSMSGWKDTEGVLYGLRALAAGAAFFPYFILLVLAFLRGEKGGAAVLWLGALFALSTHSKDGGAENYYIPLVVLAAPMMARTAGQLPFLKELIACWCLLFLATGGGGSGGLRLGWNGEAGRGAEARVSNVVQLFEGKTILSEDCLFPILAEKEPLVSDLFQLAAVQSRVGGNLDPWVDRAAGGALGGSRILHSCGDQGSGIAMSLPGAEKQTYYPNFRCSWTPGGARGSPSGALTSILLAMCAVGGLRLAIGRFMA
jgi:hypothetical protein